MLFNGNQQPRKLSPGELAKLLEPFQIRPQTIRTFAAASGRPTLKGYYRLGRGGDRACAVVVRRCAAAALAVRVRVLATR
jgi:hypothetical protein